MINLITGKPWSNEGLAQGKPATFSRFLLPFSYQLQPIKGQRIRPEQLYYESLPPQRLNDKLHKFDDDRIFYFTSETANVLYERSIWARIPEKIWEKNPARCGSFTFRAAKSNKRPEITLSPPWIMLFEGEQQNDDSHPLLQQGFLILEAYFADKEENQPTLDDLLEFNDLFRFINSPYSSHAEDFRAALSDFPADFKKCNKVKDCDEEDPVSLYKNRWLSLLDIPLQREDKLYSLIPSNSLQCEKNNNRAGHLACDDNNCLLYADNRAFVWTCAILDQGASALQKEFGGSLADPTGFGHWLKLLNVDQPSDLPLKTHFKIKKFEKNWLKERTYYRWVEDGIFYGYSYHSGAMIGSADDSLPLWYHFGQMYFDQILLLFYLRITLFAFSRKLTYINQDNDPGQLRRSFKKTRQSFAKFTNLYQFPLISNQQQGVEMYTIARKSMDIDDLFRDVRDEVTSTHEYMEMEASARLGSRANLLALIGVIIASKPLFTFVKGNYDRMVLSIALILFVLFAFWSFKYQRPVPLWSFINRIITFLKKLSNKK